MTRRFNAWYAGGLVALMAALLPFIAWNGPVQEWNLAACDFLLRLHPPSSSTVQQIVLLGLDDATVERYGPQLRRNLLAAGLQRLTASPPKVLVVELPFTEESAKDADQMLVRVMQQFPAVVLGVEQRPGEDEGQVWALPIPVLRLPNTLFGHTHLSADLDGVVRSVSLRQGDEQEGYWALAAEAALLAQGQGADLAAHGESLDIGAISVPARASNDYAMWIRPVGPVFQTYSFKRLLDGQLDPQLLAGKIVVLGVTAAGAPDLEIQASIVRALLDSDFLRSLQVEWEYTMLLAAALVPIAFAWWRQGRFLLWVTVAGVLVWPALAFAALALGWIVPLASLAVSFFTAATLAWLATFLLRSSQSA